MNNQNETSPAMALTRDSAPRSFRCWRCGELPRSARNACGHGLKCSCRGYVLCHRVWWSNAAIRDRDFPYPEQVPAAALLPNAQIGHAEKPL